MMNLMFKKKERERLSQDDDGSVFLLIGNVPPRKGRILSIAFIQETWSN